MGRADRRHVAGLNTHVVARGSYGSVRLSDEAKKAYDALVASPDEMRMAETATIRRYFDRFADKGTTGFDNTMFKPLGRFKDGTGKKAQVFEFKAFQFRLYGVLRTIAGERAFIGLCADPGKKRDKADRALLEKCAQMAAKLSPRD